MTYNPNIPLATQTIASTQSPIQTNFTQINSASSGFAVDHQTLTDNVNGGKHNQISFLQQSGDPTAANNINFLYEKSSGGKNELFMRRASNDGSAVIQMTYGTPSGTTTGSSFLPGGFTIAWGVSGATGNNGSVTIAALTTIYQVTFTINDSSVSPGSRAYLSSTGGNAFTIKVPTGGTVILSYVAIGV